MRSRTEDVLAPKTACSPVQLDQRGAIALPNVDGGGQAIVEALNQYAHQETSLGIVMLTPGD
jgi:hypothetical protein